MLRSLSIVFFASALVPSLLAGAGVARAVEPGVDIAAPRVAITVANGTTLRFVPATTRVETLDYVRWTWTSGLHTTTSGPACAADGLWSSSLDSTTTQFTRQFLEAPGTRPYFCSPHCGLGMTGSVVVTTLINLTLADLSGVSMLSWSGGGGIYRVFRSSSPLFPAGSTTVLTPAGGTTQLSFIDQTAGTPPAGSAFFYLVMNQF
jgi:plastocyanin